MNVKIIKEIPYYSATMYEALEDGTVKIETDQPSWGIPDLKYMVCFIRKGETFTLHEHELAKNPHLTCKRIGEVLQDSKEGASP